MEKILLIEDEFKVASFIAEGLIENNYKVDIASSGNKGLDLVYNYFYDLIILDINLPDINGFDVCQRIRTFNTDIPVLMLTALHTLDDKVKGFESGTDDYLAKPFEFKELLIRIQALIKRSKSKSTSANIIVVADLEINTDAKIVKRAGKMIELTAKEFQLLEYLARNKGKVMSRDDIASNVWDINFDTGTNVIEVYINFLRKKLDRNFDKRLIHTVIGMGYTLKDN